VTALDPCALTVRPAIPDHLGHQRVGKTTLLRIVGGF